MNMPRLLVTSTLLFALAACNSKDAEVEEVQSAPAAAASPIAELGPVPKEYEEPIVGGARMLAGDDILSNLEKSKDHTILVAAIKAAGLGEILRGAGPLTLFAPTDGAFKRMPGGYEVLMKPENRDDLVSLLTYHLVPGRMDAETLGRLVMEGNGSAEVETVEGRSIKATVGNGAAMVVDNRGGTARISTPNVLQSNGVVQVIETVLRP